MQNQSVQSRKSPFAKIFYYLFLLGFCLPFLTSCESQKTIVNGVDEREANEILVFLATKGIDATKVQEPTGGGGGAKLVLWDISVPSTQGIEAMALLNQQGLPRRRGDNLLNIFSNTGLVPSEMSEQIKYQAGLAEQIASVIRKIDGVLDAEVQISFPKENILNPNAVKEPITASVYVKHSGVLDDPNSHLVTKIKRLVAASVPALDYNNVTVIGDRARMNEILQGQGSIHEEEKQYVNIWYMTIAKDSVTRFRMVFFTFCIVILLLLLTFIWIGWKIYPLLKGHGGIKQLFHIHPIEVKPTPPVEAVVEKKPEPEKKGEKQPDDQGLVDKDLDES